MHERSFNGSPATNGQHHHQARCHSFTFYSEPVHVTLDLENGHSGTSHSPIGRSNGSYISANRSLDTIKSNGSKRISSHTLPESAQMEHRRKTDESTIEGATTTSNGFAQNTVAITLSDSDTFTPSPPTLRRSHPSNSNDTNNPNNSSFLSTNTESTSWVHVPRPSRHTASTANSPVRSLPEPPMRLPPVINRQNTTVFSPTEQQFELINDTALPNLANSRSEQFQASTSQALQLCKDKILGYYNRFVAVIGWRPFFNSGCNKYRVNCLVNTINFLYVTLILLLLLAGYVLQYATCFRADNLSTYDPLILATRKPDDISTSRHHSFDSFHDNNNLEYDPFVTPFSKSSTTVASNVSNQAKNSTNAALDFIESTIRSAWSGLYDRYHNLTYHNSPSISHHHDHLYRCRGGIGTYYIIPSILHFVAFVVMLKQMRAPEVDRFHNLCVLNYMLITRVSGKEKASHRLTSVIRNWLLFGLLCLAVSLGSHILHIFLIAEDAICFTFFQPQSELTETVMKVACFVLFGVIDFTCIAIFTTYALTCELNVIFLKSNVTALREKRINFREFTKNTEESKISIDYLNNTHSIGVSILLVHFVSRLFVVLIEFFINKIELNSCVLSVLAIIFWFALIIMPLVQAARVTDACKKIRHIGHELRARPFCYQQAPYSDLDSLLNYTSTLHMNARLMMIPIRASCVATIGLICVFMFLILGQINVIQF